MIEQLKTFQDVINVSIVYRINRIKGIKIFEILKNSKFAISTKEITSRQKNISYSFEKVLLF